MMKGPRALFLLISLGLRRVHDPGIDEAGVLDRGLIGGEVGGARQREDRAPPLKVERGLGHNSRGSGWSRDVRWAAQRTSAKPAKA